MSSEYASPARTETSLTACLQVGVVRLTAECRLQMCEGPFIKIQIPTPKAFASRSPSTREAPIINIQEAPRADFGDWSLKILWRLELGVWGFSFPPFHYSTTPPLHHSTTPLLHYSITPLLHYSITPLLHYSITPLLHYSTTPLRPYAPTPLVPPSLQRWPH